MTGSDFKVDPALVALLREHGLDAFDKSMACSTGTVVRSVPGRSTVRIQIGDQVAYLKRYQPPYYSWWRQLLGLDNEAQHEWEMIHTLRSHGFNAATPIACGRQGNSSFVMTLEIPGGVPADKHFRTLTGAERNKFIKQVAELTRRFHGAGFIHKDYYLSHIFVGGDQLYLIDLQRVRGPGNFHERWRIKDLGALAYTLQLAGASDDELTELLGDNKQARLVMARVHALHARGPKYDVIWDRPGERPQ